MASVALLPGTLFHICLYPGPEAEAVGRTTALSLSSRKLAHTFLPQSLSVTGGVTEASVQGLAPVECHALSDWMLLSCRVGPTADWQRKVPHT